MQRFLPFLTALVLVAGAFPAQADFAEEHPEYFGLTTPPAAGFVLPSLFEYGTRYAVRVGDLPIYWKLHVELDGEKILFIVAGPDEMSQLEAYVEEYPLQPEALGFLDVLALDGVQVGDFFPLLVTDGAVAQVVDPRFGIKKQQDDAAGSKLAELWGSCAYRPPIFLTRGYVIPLGEGRCIISKAVYTRSPGLTDAEVDGQLRAFLGCQQIISLQALQKDGEGRLDTFVRLVTPEVILVGVYNVVQDSANQYLMSKAVTDLEEALGDAFTVDTVAMPDPIVLGNETLRPSYLHYVQTTSKLILPAFKSNDSWQSKALATLQDHLPKLSLVVLDATELTYSSSRLTSIIAPYPDVPLDTQCESPEMICQSGNPLDCGLCFNECWKTGKSCVSSNEYGKCAKGDDSCYDLQVLPCPEGSACSGEGSCEAGPGDCADVPAGGFCDGDVIRKCVGDTMISIDCGADGFFCTWDQESDTAICFLPCFDDCIPETYFCDNDSVYYCEHLPEGGEGCGKRVAHENCDGGQVCFEGTCAAAPPDGNADAITEDAPGSPAADAQDWNAGYVKRDDGCAAGSGGSGSWVGISFLLLFALGAMCCRGGRKCK